MEPTVDWTQSVGSLKVAGICFALLLLLLLASAVFSRPADIQIDVKDLVQQSAQLAEVARQDSDRAIALQHITQAVTLLSVARKLASDASLLQSTGVRVPELEAILTDVQASCIAKLERRDPTLTNIVAKYATL